MALLRRKPKKVEVVESDVMEAGEELEVPKPSKALREKSSIDYYVEKYGENFSPQDFAQFGGAFESEVCKLLFAIFNEVKELKEKTK